MLMARASDKVEDVLRNHKIIFTDFYDPYHTGLVVSALKTVPGVNYRTDGGYPNAERQRVLICPEYINPENVGESGLAFLSVAGSFHGAKPSHRDFLGSILGLGLKREKIGDILINEEGAHLIVSQEVASFIRANLIRVGRWDVTVNEIGAGGLKLPEEKIKMVNTTVSTLRLDSVSAAGFGMSRSKMAEYIAAERVYLNWQLKTSLSQAVKEGDIISIRGRGRVEVSGIKGTSRGGRIFVELKRFY